ncbi:MAG: OB-fold domain-containing protein [Betaproteobacteria bacterium]|nr:OB-fold domain-containing protein [Betaproteobacteria bacterium]
MITANKSAAGERVPIREGLLTGPLSRLDRVRLAGCSCTTCGETSLGSKNICPNCGGDAVREVSLSNHGVLWSFTVVRHRPPGNYKGPDPFVPFGLGLVELSDGLRVLSPIRCDIDKLKIGLELQFKPYVRKDDDGREVVAFSFEPASQ